MTPVLCTSPDSSVCRLRTNDRSLVVIAVRCKGIVTGSIIGCRGQGTAFRHLEGVEPAALHVVNDVRLNVTHGTQAAARISAWIGPLPGLISTAIAVTVLIFGGYAVMNGEMTLGELADRMIVVSSNLATNLLIDVVSADAIQRTLERLGAAENTRVLRGVEDQRQKI